MKQAENKRAAAEASGAGGPLAQYQPLSVVTGLNLRVFGGQRRQEKT